ncbi:MAG: polysaccharide deacetylase family protein [Sphingomicrobium sp.]
MGKATGITGVRSALAAVRRRWRALRPAGPQPAILMYHRIGRESFDPWGLAVSAEHFAEQLEWLAANRTVLPLAEFAMLHRQQRLPAKAVALTFDDAYACNAVVAVPLLEKLGLPGTIFVPAELIERGQEFWWDDLERIVLGHDGDALRLGGESFALGEREAGDRQWAPDAAPHTPRQHGFHTLWAKLREQQPAVLAASMDQLRKQTDVVARPRPSHRPMTAGEVQATRSSTIAIGAHSLTHPSLPRLTLAEKRHEIVDSVARCAALSGAAPQTMAYPYGDFDAESEQLAEDAGFLCACSTEHDFVGAHSRPFALPRRHVGDWPGSRLAQMLGGS